MIASNRFTLDTNILIYAVDSGAGERHQAANELMQNAADKDCTLTVQALGEFFHATTRKGKATVVQALGFTRVWQRVFTVSAAGQATFNEAVEYVRDHSLSFWDAMLWVTAKEAGCAFILSEDMQHGRSLGGVEVLNPFADDAGRVLARLLN